MADLVEIRLNAEALKRYGLPDIGYPIPADEISAVIGGGGELSIALLLNCLQQRIDSWPAWKELEPAMDALAEVLAPEDDRPVVSAEGDGWWLEIGPVDLRGRIVTIQRGDDLLAAMCPVEGGRLRVATFRPLDATSASRLISLGQTPHPKYGVCMRENNWEYALDASAGMGQVYAAERGESYLSYWENGLGLSREGAEITTWYAQRNLAARRPALTAIEIGVAFSYSEDLSVAAADSSDHQAVSADSDLDTREMGAAFAECSVFYRDADVPESIANLYQAGLIFREPTFCDATCKFGGFTAPHRYLIISANARCIDEYSENPEWGLCVWKPGSIFKVIGLHRFGEHAQTTLLEIPEDLLGRFSGPRLSGLETEFARIAEEKFQAALVEPPNAELLTEAWANRVALPLGVGDDGEFIEAWK